MKRFLNNKRQRYPIVSAEDEGLLEYFKQHPNVAGMAIGEGLNGIEGQRRIVHNPYSTAIPDPNDPRWEALDRVESIRHYMDETNYAPTFKFSPEQIRYRQTELKGMPYETNDRAWRQSIISRIAVGDTAGLNVTPEQQVEYNNFIKGFEGGPLGTKQVVIGKDPHNNRQYIKPMYIPFLKVLKRDSRGHLPDIVKGKDHPSGPSYGKFLNDLQFEIKDPANINYVREGLNDNGDYKATVTYKGSRVLPEITITPNGNYIEDPYNNIKFLYAKGGLFRIPYKKAYGGRLFKRSDFPNFQTGGTIPVGKAAKTAFKIFKGDHLKLMKQRLKNGGFERLAKTAKEDEAIKPSPGGMGEYKQNLLTKSKDWLLAQEPMKVSSKELEEYKRKHGLPKPVTSPKSGASSLFGKYYTDLYTDAPEKLKAIPNDKHLIAAHEYSHFVYKPSTTAPGFNYDKFPTMGLYFHGKNGSSELAARGSQLKNYFGLNKGSDDITPEMLTYAKEHYVKDTGIDNNMTSMFESVEDSNKFSNWISKNAPLIPLELAMKSIVLRNQPDPLSAKKGSKIAKHSWSANFGHTVDGNPNLDNMKNDYVTKKKKKHA